MALDADIAAAGIVDLEKIKVQDWRNDNATKRALEAAQAAAFNAREDLRLKALEEQTQVQQQVYGQLGIEDINELIVALAPNYMKPSTATTVDGMTSDTDRDGEFLRLAIRKVLSVRDEFLGA